MKSMSQNILKLNANNLAPKDYETQLANEVITDKLNQIFNIPSKDEELKMLASSYLCKML